ncbi:MAG: twin-arginine translocation signal domain-containing protein [Flexilinea sp.]|nr:twin-arginine translocation signal domain-containing protein [Flexilinea sp.]
MEKHTNDEKPEVYALRQEDGNWQISRRDFLKAAGVGAAAVGAGLSSGFIQPVFGASEKDLQDVCDNAYSHQSKIDDLFVSADGKYLLSHSYESSGDRLKCWDFDTFVLAGWKKFKRAPYHLTAGFINGKSSVVYESGRNICSLELPYVGKATERTINIDSKYVVTAVSVAKNGNIYAADDGRGTEGDEKRILKIIKKEGKNSYNKPEELPSPGEVERLSAFDDGKKLFVQYKSGECGVVDTADGSLNKFDVESIIDYAVVPGETSVLVLVGEESKSYEYRLYSLLDGKMLWAQESSMLFYRIAVTPDASTIILLMDSRISLRAVSDGNLIRSENLGTITFGSECRLAVSGDGTKLAVSRKNSILFVSLPDLKLIGCPVDLKEMKDNTKGVKVEGVDVVTGKKVTYTMPCGAEIPAGAVCTCNCVAGSTCACNSYKSCSCNSHRTSYSSSYWYPN